MTESTPSTTRRMGRLFTWRRLTLSLVWLLTVVVAVRGWGFVVQKRIPILRRLGLLEKTGIMQTNLYVVGFQRVPVAIDGRYGAIAPLANGVLFSARSGRLWFVDSTRTPRELALRIPINVEEFEADPYNARTVNPDHFAVKGMMTQVTPNGVRLFASHNQWNGRDKCYTLRVSMIELPVDSMLAGASGQWKTLFDSRPCMELGLLASGEHMPTIGAGGRMIPLSDHEILLTVGVFIADAKTTTEPKWITSLDNDYGKTIAIDLVSGRARIFSKGHRNPQGLAIGPDSSIWETEHAAKGGDELNLLRDGLDYGFPYVSYGTDYGRLDWPLSDTPGRHEGFEKPLFAWVPSIATSQLVVVSGKAFEHWRGDLLVSSLAARSVFRVRVEEGRVRFVEPMQMIHRMRDIIETSRGEIAILAEDGFLVYLQPVDAKADNPGLSARDRGQIVAGQCQGCHSFEKGGPDGIGPNLFGIVGRGIASTSFAYSAGLRAVSGSWTDEQIRKYVKDPAAFAPGTPMVVPVPLSDRELDDLATYLRSLK